MPTRKQTYGIEKGKPITLPNGTVIDKNVDGETTLETKDEQEARWTVDDITADPFDDPQLETFERSLADINVTSRQFNPVMLVLGYSMWGLPDYAIARFLDLTDEQVEQIKSSSLYADTRKQMLEAVRYAEASSIHGYLSQKAKAAAATVVSKMKSKSEDIALNAAKDILDRSGYRPADRVEHTMRFEDDLRIVHLTEDQPIDIDTGV